MARRRRTDYQVRTRYIYALVFDRERAVYIGQSVDPTRRATQHRSSSGGWLSSFRVVILEELNGTYSDAEKREHVWRWIAHLRWWTVYVLPPNVRVRLGRRMPFVRRLEAWWTMITQGWPVRRLRPT